MKTLSIKIKLSLLSGFLLGLVLLIGIQGFQSVEKVGKQLHEIADTQLPAVRNMTLIDMIHDGLRAIVYESLLVSGTQDQEKKKVIQDDFKEAALNIQKYKDAIEQLNVTQETKKAIQDSHAEITAYTQSAEEIINLANQDKKDLAQANLSKFNDAFSSLEVKLEHLGELIEKDAEANAQLGASIIDSSKQWSLALVFLGMLIGIGASFVIIRGLLKALNSIVENLAKTSNEVAATSTQIASSSERLSQASTEQAASLEETAASLEEISAMIAKASDGADSTATSSTESQQKAEEGRSAVDQMLTSMDEISQSNEAIMHQVTESNRQMSEIVRVIQDIGNKTKVINEIVFQTKLLSFNASVEAARAGEHGKGFAVVAEEVGNLAQMSGNAAKEISDMLQGSISRVEKIVTDTKTQVESLIEAGKEKVNTGINVARQCSSLLSEIVDNVSKVTALSQEISQASKEQSQGVSEINKAMSQLDTVTQQNATTSEETATAARQLAQQTETLQTMVEEVVTIIQGANSHSSHRDPELSTSYSDETAVSRKDSQHDQAA